MADALSLPLWVDLLSREHFPAILTSVCFKVDMAEVSHRFRKIFENLPLCWFGFVRLGLLPGFPCVLLSRSNNEVLAQSRLLVALLPSLTHLDPIGLFSRVNIAGLPAKFGH